MPESSFSPGITDFIARLKDYAPIDEDLGETHLYSVYTKILAVVPDLEELVYLGHDFDGDDKIAGHNIAAATDGLFLYVPLDYDRPATAVSLRSLSSLELHGNGKTRANFEQLTVDIPLGKYPSDGGRAQTKALVGTLVEALEGDPRVQWIGDGDIDGGHA
ncbi:hypothetical protein [Sinomonas sp. P47F7]|uniref:hypothetical protein n=1 Tax=Sinomonas sp. P47F7 TaxID=3410987 RepID=UPI003BF534DE